MGMRELLILILILAIIGVFLRGLYLAVRSRRGQLKIALEKNVPEYDLEEIELRELPNGGARVVERSFAHVQQENQRFASRKKTRASQQARAAATTRTPSRSASVKTASLAARTSQSIPVLMNSVPAGAGVQVHSLEKAKEPPIMDDLISALDDELDHQVQSDRPLNGRQKDSVDGPVQDVQDDLQEDLQNELQEELQEMLDVQEANERDADDYMEPARIEVEMLEESEQPEVAAIHVAAEPPVLTEPVVPAATNGSESVTARATPEADGDYDDDTETNYDSYEADQHIEEQSYTEVDGPEDELEEVFISKKGDRDIFGDIDNAGIDFDDDEFEQRRSQIAAADSGSAMSRLRGWGAKLFGRGNAAERSDATRGDTRRHRDPRDADDVLFDAPVNHNDDDDFDVGVSSVRESPRNADRRAQSKQAQPQQQSLLNMDDEGAPLADDPAYHEVTEKPFADKTLAKSHSQAEKAAQAPGRLHSQSAAAPRPARAQASAAPAPSAAQQQQERAKAEAAEEAARISHNNNIAPDYSEVLIVNVMARGDSEFAGVELLPAMLSCGLRFGDMNIFHRHVDDKGVGPVLFSVANILNPGTFDLNQVNDFSTRGVCFFLTLPNVINNMQAFDRMIDTAQRLRAALDGELKDDNRSVMTAQTIEHYRQRIRDFELRQLRHH